ncbi:MAG: hemerythrin domain-containing protein [Burkholderiaceae bacterium]|nr:hemerythrin domain-containing protein [Burkholderiaceae bacterium]MCD8516560.1 hemerythrin domain-containing protein [Burkholderiaceae bacterium]MCD8536366.1 hemerythrin domain-containing protein [Burkholderiaceae bacterium]MCD8565217.1 hemerythrin domain-containing protein [Burkholderiaceae bacterium]
MEAMRILLDEHQSLAAIIHAIRHMIREIEAGKLKPDFKLLHAMVHYLDAYPEKKHHPKEDEFLFARLRARTDRASEVLDRLEAEHATSDERIAALTQALKVYEADPANGFKTFQEAFDKYAEFYREHMMLEEREVLPLIRECFTEEDWAFANAGFEKSRDPMGGTRRGSDEEDFGRIFSKLVEAAPAPIGLGLGPYKDD